MQTLCSRRTERAAFARRALVWGFMGCAPVWRSGLRSKPCTTRTPYQQARHYLHPIRPAPRGNGLAHFRVSLLCEEFHATQLPAETGTAPHPCADSRTRLAGLRSRLGGLVPPIPDTSLPSCIPALVGTRHTPSHVWLCTPPPPAYRLSWHGPPNLSSCAGDGAAGGGIATLYAVIPLGAYWRSLLPRGITDHRSSVCGRRLAKGMAYAQLECISQPQRVAIVDERIPNASVFPVGGWVASGSPAENVNASRLSSLHQQFTVSHASPSILQIYSIAD